MKWLIRSNTTQNYVHSASFNNDIDSMWVRKQRDALRFNTPDDARAWCKDFKAHFSHGTAYSDFRVVRVRK